MQNAPESAPVQTTFQKFKKPLIGAALGLGAVVAILKFTVESTVKISVEDFIEQDLGGGYFKEESLILVDARGADLYVVNYAEAIDGSKIEIRPDLTVDLYTKRVDGFMYWVVVNNVADGQKEFLSPYFVCEKV